MLSLSEKGGGGEDAEGVICSPQVASLRIRSMRDKRGTGGVEKGGRLTNWFCSRGLVKRTADKGKKETIG